MRPRLLVLLLLAFALPSATQGTAAVRFAAADIGDGIVLHYAEEGSGAPVVFVHGSLSGMTYWKDQVNAFAIHYRPLAYVFADPDAWTRTSHTPRP